jgi:hypothetical protein
MFNDKMFNDKMSKDKMSNDKKLLKIIWWQWSRLQPVCFTCCWCDIFSWNVCATRDRCYNF